MGMSLDEQATKELLVKTLGEEGHGKFAEYLSLFDLYFIKGRDADTQIAYMYPDHKAIFINKDVTDLDLMTLLMRHEMMHQILNHGKRFEKYIRKKLNIPEDKEVTFKDALDSKFWTDARNIAADWELSYFYSPITDFNKIKNMSFKDAFVQGLVLELDEPEYFKKHLDYEGLMDELDKKRDKIKKLIQQNFISDVAIGFEGMLERIEEDLEEMKKQASQMQKQLQKAQGQEKEDLQKKLDDLNNDIKHLQEIIDELQDDLIHRGAGFTESDKTKLKRSQAIKNIKDFWKDLKNEEEAIEQEKEVIFDERQLIKNKEKAKGDRDALRNLSKDVHLQPMTNFVLSLNQTIKKQIQKVDNEINTYTKVNRTTAAIKGIYRPGISITKKPNKHIPNIAVYYDRSNSWKGDALKTSTGDRVIKALRDKYEKPGKEQIKTEKFYCADGPVMTNRMAAEKQSGGMDGPAVVKHIIETQPDNVIIMTDSDPESYDYNQVAQISGAVWILFYDDQTSGKLAAHIRGSKNEYYDLTSDSGLDKMLPDNMQEALNESFSKGDNLKIIDWLKENCRQELLSNDRKGLAQSIFQIIKENPSGENIIYSQIRTFILEHFNFDILDYFGEEIPKNFFSGDSLKEISIPDSIKKLGNDCFSNCTSLTSIDLKNVIEIGASCFSECRTLTSIDLKNVTKLTWGTFYNCTALTSVDLKNVIEIGDHCFYNCTSLTSITIPNSVTEIDNDCFNSCTSLTSIDLKNVTKIHNDCFSNCTSLTSVDLKNVIEIGDYCFYGCTSLTSINIPSSVKELGVCCFDDCDSLKEIIYNVDNKIYQRLKREYGDIVKLKG